MAFYDMEDQAAGRDDTLVLPRDAFLQLSGESGSPVNDSDFNLSSDLSKLWNTSGGLNLDLILKFERNLRLGGALLAALLLVYGAVITIGVAGNSLVVLAVIRKPAMRTARNVFIINLAISDLVLCLATTPLTLLEILSQYWPLGDTPFLCKLVGTLQATSTFVSTISITATALDRYHDSFIRFHFSEDEFDARLAGIQAQSAQGNNSEQRLERRRKSRKGERRKKRRGEKRGRTGGWEVILHPTRRSLGTSGALFVLPGIWASALFLAMPQFLFRTLSHHVINLPGVEAVDFCFEEWPVEHGRAYYSVFVMLVQFFVPLLTVTVSYARIVHKLKYRMAASSIRKNKPGKEENRNRKTNILLMAIAIIFCLSWLPLNLFHIIVDFLNPFGEDTDTMLTVYAVCHLLGMSSACSNPVLYGWLNDNFRKEFVELWHIFTPCRHRSLTSKSKVCCQGKTEKLTKSSVSSKDHPDICLIVKKDENFAELSHSCNGYEIIAQPFHTQPRVVDLGQSTAPLETLNGLADLSMYVKCTSV
ncbi:G protein-coupled receptor rhodopsin-like [Trinorchestia longiramus]|nr:G protein-coupled receptor rhodopsin-like [Trinorchestia longiramus]